MLVELDHPRVLRYYGLYEDGAGVYIVTELCKGCDRHATALSTCVAWLTTCTRAVFEQVTGGCVVQRPIPTAHGVSNAVRGPNSARYEVFAQQEHRPQGLEAREFIAQCQR